jgi:hypothetical protein
MTSEEGPIGAAWRCDDGTIRIELMPYIQLTAAKSLSILLLPRVEAAVTPAGQPAAATSATTAVAVPASESYELPTDDYTGPSFGGNSFVDFDDSDIPF